MTSVRVQKPVPEFSATALMPNGTFQKLGNKDFAGKYWVLFFYPLDFTFVCPTEIIAFSERIGEFEALQCSVVACSIDSEFSHLAWTQMDRKKGGLGKMNIPMLADVKREVAEKFGVLVDDGVAARGLFIIDAKGVVRQITINDLPVGRNVDETLRLVKAFQFTDVHGEVCPANWNPGDKTMKADPVGSQAFFAAAP